MDLVPPSNGETLVKSPMVDVDAVDVKQVDEETVALEVTSEFETDSDDSDGDDAGSDCGRTIQFLRDDQLHEGRFFRSRVDVSRLTPDIPATRNPPCKEDVNIASLI